MLSSWIRQTMSHSISSIKDKGKLLSLSTPRIARPCLEYCVHSGAHQFIRSAWKLERIQQKVPRWSRAKNTTYNEAFKELGLVNQTTKTLRNYPVVGYKGDSYWSFRKPWSSGGAQRRNSFLRQVVKSPSLEVFKTG